VPVAHARIDGAVTTPNVYEVKEGITTLNELIGDAGKMLPLADVEHVEFVRKGQPTRILNLLELQRRGGISKIDLKDGDGVFIPYQENTVLLVGAVPTPGPLPVKPGMKIVDFFTTAAPTALDPSRANLSDVVLRRGDEPARKINLND